MASPIPSEIKKAVTFIFLAEKDGTLKLHPQTKKPIPNGTGFLTCVPNESNSNLAHGYLVTAKHVLQNPDGSFQEHVFLRLDKRDGKADFVPLSVKQAGVCSSPDQTVDVAVIPFLPNPDIFDFKVVPSEMLATKDVTKEGINEGTDVFFTGLYPRYYGEQHNNAIVRFGKVAMFPDDRIQWASLDGTSIMAELYLLETQSYGGNSGSPVYFYLGSDRTPGVLVLGTPAIRLAGVMSGFFGEATPLQVLDGGPSSQNQSFYTNQNMGIAAVTPAYLLRDILYSDVLRQMRVDQSK